jgi:methyltransferase
MPSCGTRATAAWLHTVSSRALLSIGLLIFVPMLLEAARASRNERRQLARGGVQPADDVHNVMRVVYPGSFIAMVIEGTLRGAPPSTVMTTGVAVFVLAKLIKWAAIVTLGSQWTFRVIVVPGDALVTRGPYRVFRHPNYVGVIGEFIGAALMTGALISGPLALLGFGALLRKRIAVEERALASGRTRDAILRAE